MTGTQIWKGIGSVLALTCALPLLCVGYALACSPVRGDPWFELIVNLNTRTLPKDFALKAGRIEKTAPRDCILADGERFESYSSVWLSDLAKNAKSGDGRPAHPKLPKPETVKLEVYCDPQRYVTHGRLSYIPIERMPGNWGSHMELDLESVKQLITTQASERGPYSAASDLFIDRVEPAENFCTMSAQRLFDDRPWRGAHTFGHGSLSLADLAGASRHVGIVDVRHITAHDAAVTKTFDVYLDCYRSKSVVKANVHYVLNKLYRPDRRQRSIEACGRYEH